MLQTKKEKWPRMSLHHWPSLSKNSQSTPEGLNHHISKVSTYAKHHSTPSKETGRERERERETSARGDIMCVMYMCTCVKETAPLDITMFKNLGSVIMGVLHCYRQ